MPEVRPRAAAWLPVAAWMAGIYYASSLPGSNIPALFSFQDVVFHGSVYAILGVLIARALKVSVCALSRGAIIIITCIIGMAYGASDEWHQHFVSGRSVSLKDWFVDSLGVFMGAWIYR